ncbi:unnamed protein product [Urochloa humidicola]
MFFRRRLASSPLSSIPSFVHTFRCNFVAVSRRLGLLPSPPRYSFRDNLRGCCDTWQELHIVGRLLLATSHCSIVRICCRNSRDWNSTLLRGCLVLHRDC